MYLCVGAAYAPRGKRLRFALNHARDRTTLFGGSIAMWSFLFNSTRLGLQYVRQVDDKWNATFGGFSAGVIAHLRSSLRLGIYQGLQYGTLFYVIYGLSEKGQRLQEEQSNKVTAKKNQAMIDFMVFKHPDYYMTIVEANKKLNEERL